MKTLPKFSMGVGDRFGHQGQAQLRALLRAKDELGVEIAPVWNKSNREHTLIGTRPEDTRRAADAAVAAMGYAGDYFVDADHIGLANVDKFMTSCDFFTLDVAEDVKRTAPPAACAAFVERHAGRVGKVEFLPDKEILEAAARKYLAATMEAGRIYRHIETGKGRGNFVVEVSMDETDRPQTPSELLVILLALADEGIPAQTIAPKFSGRFNKGVDYVGDVAAFTKEFEDDVRVVSWAVQNTSLPGNLKLSVHSGSDKFSLYPVMGEILMRHGAGLHLKTAGTTWLEELIGLAESGGDGLALAKEIYGKAHGRREELCAPYATVIDIRGERLPTVAAVATWTSRQFADALRHDTSCASYNPDFRQVLHVAFKVAGEMGERYAVMLAKHEATIARNVEANLYERHLLRFAHGLHKT